MKKVLVCGAGGFIGGHLVTSLKEKGYYVIGADIKQHEYKITDADEFYQYDLREQDLVRKLVTSDIDTIYQLAADAVEPTRFHLITMLYLYLNCSPTRN